jgi:hypothetical protein
MPTRLQGLMWGTLPIGSSILALLVLLIPDKRAQYTPEQVDVNEVNVVRQPLATEDLVLGRVHS